MKKVFEKTCICTILRAIFSSVYEKSAGFFNCTNHTYRFYMYDLYYRMEKKPYFFNPGSAAIILIWAGSWEGSKLTVFLFGSGKRWEFWTWWFRPGWPPICRCCCCWLCLLLWSPELCRGGLWLLCRPWLLCVDPLWLPFPLLFIRIAVSFSLKSRTSGWLFTGD